MSLLCTCVRAQVPTSRGLQTALNHVFEKGNLMVALSAVEWRPGLALAATEIQAGDSRTLVLALQQNVNYAFIASAHTETTDVDLYLRDKAGNIIAQDQEADGSPVLEFRVPRTGNYQVQVHLSAANEPQNFVALSLLQSSGQPINVRDYRLQSNRFFTASAALFDESPSLKWLNTPQGWAILGLGLRNDTPHDLTNLYLPAGEYKIAGTGAPTFKNLSLYLANAKGAFLGRSDTKRPFPFLQFEAPVAQPYQLRVAPKGNKVSGLLLLGIFQH